MCRRERCACLRRRYWLSARQLCAWSGLIVEWKNVLSFFRRKLHIVYSLFVLFVCNCVKIIRIDVWSCCISIGLENGGGVNFEVVLLVLAVILWFRVRQDHATSQAEGYSVGPSSKSFGRRGGDQEQTVCQV